MLWEKLAGQSGQEKLLAQCWGLQGDYTKIGFPCSPYLNELPNVWVWPCHWSPTKRLDTSSDCADVVESQGRKCFWQNLRRIRQSISETWVLGKRSVIQSV